MAEFEIRPFVGIGPITFDMTTTQVGQHLGPAIRRREDTWWYHDDGLSVEFDAVGRCRFVECFPPATPILDGLPLTPPYDELLRALRRRGYACWRGVDAEVGSTHIEGLGVIVYQHDRDEGAQEIDTVSVWESAHYEATFSDEERAPI